MSRSRNDIIATILKRDYDTISEYDFLELKYKVYGLEYVKKLKFSDSDLKSDYKIGDEIEIVVDKNNPKNIVILDFYR